MVFLEVVQVTRFTLRPQEHPTPLHLADHSSLLSLVMEVQAVLEVQEDLEPLREQVTAWFQVW